MNRTRWLVTAAAGLAAVMGGGAALAATGSSDPASDFLGDVADRLGISQDKLEGAIEDASIARIDAAVARGDLTKEQGEKLKEQIRSGDGPEILPGFRGPKLGIGPLGPPPDKGFVIPGPVPGFGLIEKAADYLGMDAADVREALRDGKSLADLAKDRGKSADGLKQTLREAIRKRGIGPAHGKGFFPRLDFIERTADYLGMDAADVREALNDGKSLADLAKDKGKSVDGLEQALRDAIREDVDDEAIADQLSATIDEMVERGRFKFHLRPRLQFAPG